MLPGCCQSNLIRFHSHSPEEDEFKVLNAEVIILKDAFFHSQTFTVWDISEHVLTANI